LVFGVGLCLLFQVLSWLLVCVLVMAPELHQALQLVVDFEELHLACYKTSQVLQILFSQHFNAIVFFTEDQFITHVIREIKCIC
jgi:hypothetical protein